MNNYYFKRKYSLFNNLLLILNYLLLFIIYLLHIYLFYLLKMYKKYYNDVI